KLLAVTDYSPLQFYKVPSLELVKTAGSRGPVFATNGSWLAYIGNKGIIKRESLDAPEQVLVPGGTNLQQLALSPDGRIVASSEWSGAKIWFWDARDGHSLGRPLSGHTLRIVALAFTPDSRTLVSCGWDGQLGIWDVRGRTNLAFLRGHNNSFNQAVLSPDGSTIATGGDDSLVRLWNVARRQEIAVLQGLRRQRQRRGLLAGRSVVGERVRRRHDPAVAGAIFGRNRQFAKSRMMIPRAKA